MRCERSRNKCRFYGNKLVSFRQYKIEDECISDMNSTDVADNGVDCGLLKANIIEFINHIRSEYFFCHARRACNGQLRYWSRALIRDFSWRHAGSPSGEIPAHMRLSRSRISDSARSPGASIRYSRFAFPPRSGVGSPGLDEMNPLFSSRSVVPYMAPRLTGFFRRRDARRQSTQHSPVLAGVELPPERFAPVRPLASSFLPISLTFVRIIADDRARKRPCDRPENSPIELSESA